MEIKFLLYVFLIFFSYGDLRKGSSWGVRHTTLFQLLVTVFWVSGKYYFGKNFSEIDDLYLLSIFSAPLFLPKLESQNHVPLLLLPTILFTQSILNTGLLEGLVGLGFLTLLFSLYYRLIKETIVSALFLIMVYLKLNGVDGYYEIWAPIIYMGSLFCFSFYNKIAEHLRFYFIVIMAVSVLLPNQSLFVEVLFALLLIPFSLFLAEKRSFKCLILSIFLSSQTVEKTILVQTIIFYFISYFTMSLLSQLREEIEGIEFKEGSLTISYGQVAFILCSLVILSGFYPTIYSWGHVGTVSSQAYLLPLIYFLPLTIRYVLVSPVGASTQKGEKESTLLIMYLLSLLLFFTLDREAFSFNPYPVATLFLILLIIVLSKRNLIVISKIGTTFEKLSLYPIIGETQPVRYKRNLNKKPKRNLDWLSFPRFSYSISVGVVFLMISLVFLELLS